MEFRKRRPRRRFGRRKVCRFCADKSLVIDYKSPQVLRYFITERGKLDLSDRPELINQGDGIRKAGIYDQLKDSKEVMV